MIPLKTKQGATLFSPALEQITGVNYNRTLTGNQQKAFDVISNGRDINIFVRGKNGEGLGLASGTNITGRVADLKVIANNTQNGQPQTVKTIPVNKPAVNSQSTITNQPNN